MSSKKSRYLPIGIYSEATLRPLDLLGSLASALDDVHLTRRDRGLVRTAMAFCGGEVRKAGADGYSVRATELYSDLIDIADDYCAPYTYYGSGDGDGACVGVWIYEDSLYDDIRYGDLIEIDDLADLPTGYTGRAILTADHGNLSLYSVTRGRAREIWSIV